MVTAAVVALLLALPLAKRAVNALGLPLQYSSVIRQEAAAKHLDPALVAAVIYAETKFDARTSPAGAVGLMQLMPETATFLAKRSGATTFTTADLSTPQVNIAYGSYYLRYLLNVYHGNTVLALAAYNGGETNVDSWVRSAHGTALPRRRHPVPRDPRLRAAGADRARPVPQDLRLRALSLSVLGSARRQQRTAKAEARSDRQPMLRARPPSVVAGGSVEPVTSARTPPTTSPPSRDG